MVAGHFRYTQYAITLVSAFTQRALSWMPALDSIISQLGMATPLARWAAAASAAATVPKPTLRRMRKSGVLGKSGVWRQEVAKAIVVAMLYALLCKDCACMSLRRRCRLVGRV